MRSYDSDEDAHTSHDPEDVKVEPQNTDDEQEEIKPPKKNKKKASASGHMRSVVEAVEISELQVGVRGGGKSYIVESYYQLASVIPFDPF